MHVFTLWQSLRDETNFCWERCPSHKTNPGSLDAIITTTNFYHHYHTISVLSTMLY